MAVGVQVPLRAPIKSITYAVFSVGCRAFGPFWVPLTRCFTRGVAAVRRYQDIDTDGEGRLAALQAADKVPKPTASRQKRQMRARSRLTRRQFLIRRKEIRDGGPAEGIGICHS
jgi:hypothetical protein